MIQPPADTSLLSFNQILVRLQVRAKLILTVFLATVLLVALILLIVPRAYTSSADIFIDYRENDPLSGVRFSAMLDDSYMRTQRELLSSRLVIEKAIERLGLLRTAAFREDEAENGPRAFENLVTRMQANTVVSSASNSRVITVSYTADSPEQARDTVNALVEAYLQTTRDMALLGATERTEQYRQQLEALRQNAEQAQEALTRYQQESGLLLGLDGDDSENRRLRELQASQYQLQNQLAAALSRNHAWQQQLESGVPPQELPEVGRLPQVVELQARYTDVIRRLAEASVNLGPNHPSVRALRQEAEQLAHMQRNEAQSIYDAQRGEALVVATQLDEVNRQIAAQRELVLLRMNQRDQVVALQRKLASAEQIYRAALENYDQILFAGIAPHNISVLRPAALPIEASRPRVMQSLLASMLAGLFLGICLALLLELWQRRLRCLDDMLRTVPAPNLGRIGAPDTLSGSSRP